MVRSMPRGVEVAGLMPRLVAWLIDISVPAALGVLAWFLRDWVHDPTALLVTTIAVSLLQLGWALLLWWGYGGRGAGPGFRLMGLQLVGIDDGRPVGWWRYFLRQLVWSAVMATVVGGIVMLVFLVIQERRQGWHDLAARSVAIRARRRAVAGASGRTVTQPRKTPSTTVALPPHLVAKAFDGSAAPAAKPAEDPVEAARRQAAFGGRALTEESGWRPPSAPGEDQGRQPTVRHGLGGTDRQDRGAQRDPGPDAGGPGADQRGQAPSWSQTSAAGRAPSWNGPSGAHQAHGSAHAPGSGQAPLPGQATAPGPAVPSRDSAPAEWTAPPAAGAGTGPWDDGERPTGRRAAPVDADDGMTVVRPRQSRAAEPEDRTHLAPRRAPRAAHEGWFLALDDGRKVDLFGLVLVGRRPAQAADGRAHLLTVGEGGQAVSKNHFQLGVDARGVWLSDVGSTNGTAVVTGPGTLAPCPPGQQVRLTEGQVVSFGDHTLTLRRHPES